MSNKCERCGRGLKKDVDPDKSEHMFDYCAECYQNLCPECMAKGCCRNVPAKSGNESDNS